MKQKQQTNVQRLEAYLESIWKDCEVDMEKCGNLELACGYVLDCLLAGVPHESKCINIIDKY